MVLMCDPFPYLPKPRPYFGSGPTAKPKGWSLNNLSTRLISRSHRSTLGLQAIEKLLRLVKQVLRIPESHFIALVPGSASGAISMALWNLLGTRPVAVCVEDVFGQRWFKDIKQNLPFLKIKACGGSPGMLTELNSVPPDHDIVFLWNGSTNGMCVPSADFIPLNRDGLIICDATSAVYGMDIAWDRLDATAFSWQKGLGGEAGFGMLVLSPKALAHLKNVPSSHPVPFILNLRNDPQKLFEGKTLNTISMLCLEDALWCHEWAINQGGLDSLTARSKTNLRTLERWVNQQDSEAPFAPRFLVADPLIRSSTTICLEINYSCSDPRLFYKEISEFLHSHHIAYDILNHSAAPPCLRIWGGPTVEKNDIECLIEWLDFLLCKSHNHTKFK